MRPIILDEALWATRLIPEGMLEQWCAEDGQVVELGDRIAEVRIEDQLHEITAPAGGRLYRLSALGDVVEPGAVIAELR